MAQKNSTPSPEGAAGGVSAPYVVLARKYRPKTFADLIGQDAMVTTLRNAFASGRIAQGYMLTGVRGVGKTTTARILARGLNYSRDGAPDAPSIDMPELGRHCAEIMESRHPDVVEMDAASNTGVDNIREVIESARYRPLLARYKVFVIDEVHMLSKGAFNALLKTLEEPPEHAKFIFATTEIRKVPLTVLSRCQRFDLRRVEGAALAAHFRRILDAEGATADEDALLLIARAAEGSVRDGLSILDQAIAMGRGRVAAGAVRAMLGLADRGRILDVLEKALRGQAGAALADMAALHRDGAEPLQILADMADAAHAIARAKAVGDTGHVAASVEERARVGAFAERLSVPTLSRAFQILSKGYEEAGRARNPATAAEMVLIRLAYMADLPSPEALIEGLTQGFATPGRRHDAAVAAPLAEPPAQKSVAALEPPPSAPAPAAVAAAERPALTAFPDVLALIGEQRDAKLKVHLEEKVSLVRFDGAARAIDVFLLPGAPAGLANELQQKLTRWTGERWAVTASDRRGEPPVGETARATEAAEMAALEAHPTVSKVLAAFPGARISGVRRSEAPRAPGDGGSVRD